MSEIKVRLRSRNADWWRLPELNANQRAVVDAACSGDVIARGAPSSGRSTCALAVFEEADAQGRSALILAPDRTRADVLTPRAQALGPDAVRPVRTPASFAYQVVATWRTQRDVPLEGVELVTGAAQDQMLAEALAEGVNGFITKDESTENVAAALLRASRGEPVMSSRPTKMLVDAYQSEQKRATAEARIQELVNELPPRLQDVYTCLLEGLTNRRIARKLGISENTVRIYVSEVLHRLGHTSRTELIAAALGN